MTLDLGGIGKVRSKNARGGSTTVTAVFGTSPRVGMAIESLDIAHSRWV